MMCENNYIEWSDDKLQDRLNELHENNRSIQYTGERKNQVEREMTNIAFEMSERIRERRNEEIEEAWNERV